MLLYDDDDNMIPPSSGSAAARLADYNAGGSGRTADERLHDLKIMHALVLQRLAAKQERCTDQQEDMKEVLTMIEAVLDMEVLLTWPTKVKLRGIVEKVREHINQ